jgi:hypothetical protein
MQLWSREDCIVCDVNRDGGGKRSVTHFAKLGFRESRWGVTRQIYRLCTGPVTIGVLGAAVQLAAEVAPIWAGKLMGTVGG